MSTWKNMTNVTFDEIQPGATASLTRSLSQIDIEVLALVSGDVDPFHLSTNGQTGRNAASSTEAVGAEALIAAVLGTKLPGPGMRILREDLRFRGAIHAGDNVTATVNALEKRVEGNEVVFGCRCVNQAGDELVTGRVVVAAPDKAAELRRSNAAGVIPTPRRCLRRPVQGVRRAAAGFLRRGTPV